MRIKVLRMLIRGKLVYENYILFTAVFFALVLCSFAFEDKFNSEFEKLQKLELLALKKGSIGKFYTYDLTNKKDCNKTTIKYLGIIKTNKGNQYKVLSSFFVYTAASSCHGSSNIKIFNMKNEYVGKYNVGLPDDLPTMIKESKSICWTKNKECNLRDEFLINFEKGLPKKMFIPCSESGGNELVLSNK